MPHIRDISALFYLIPHAPMATLLFKTYQIAYSQKNTEHDKSLFYMTFVHPKFFKLRLKYYSIIEIFQFKN